MTMSFADLLSGLPPFEEFASISRLSYRVSRVELSLAIFCFVLALVIVTFNATKPHAEAPSPPRAVLTHPAAQPKRSTPCVQDAEWRDVATIACSTTAR